MLVEFWNYLRLDVHHYMDLLELKGQLVHGSALSGNAVNDNLAPANPLGGLPGGDNQAVA